MSVDVLLKPVTEDELCDALERALDVGKGQEVLDDRRTE